MPRKLSCIRGMKGSLDCLFTNINVTIAFVAEVLLHSSHKHMRDYFKTSNHSSLETACVAILSTQFTMELICTNSPLAVWCLRKGEIRIFVSHYSPSFRSRPVKYSYIGLMFTVLPDWLKFVQMYSHT